jgi:TPR repeat protein
MVMRRLALIGSALMVLANVLAAPAAADDGVEERRVALVIGNSGYQNVPPLANPANDARLIASTLTSLGFKLIGDGPLLDADRPAMEKSIREFGRALQGGAVGLFYYSGHGIQVRGSNYLVPISAAVSQDADIKYELLDLGFVLDEMANAGNRLNIVILDACRNNPLGGHGTRAVSSGLGQMTAPAGTVISYATQPDNVASDGTGPDSPYTAALAAALRKPGQDLFATFNEVGLQVKQATGGQQQPWLSVSPIEGQFYFAGLPGGTAAVAAAPAADPDVEMWEAAKQGNRVSDYSDYVSRFPKGQFVAVAQHHLMDECETAVAPSEGAAGRSVELPLGKIDVPRAVAACRAIPQTSRSSYLLGRAQEAENHFDEAAKSYAQAADEGNATAQASLAALYLDGRGVAQDAGEAVRWYRAAADQGYAPAQVALGQSYELGSGAKKDEAEAVRWYRKAAEQGNAQGEVFLARMYDMGRGVIKDDAEVVRWYRKAAELGNAEAEYGLGYAYANGQGIETDDVLAVSWYRKAAEQGYPAAERNLGWCYQYGRGVARDAKEAARWYRKAAEQGNKEAKDYLTALSASAP